MKPKKVIFRTDLEDKPLEDILRYTWVDTVYKPYNTSGSGIELAILVTDQGFITTCNILDLYVPDED